MSRASEIRAALKKAGYTSKQVSVTGPNYPRVTVKVHGIDFATVEEIAGQRVGAARGLLAPSRTAAKTWLEALPADRKLVKVPGLVLEASHDDAEVWAPRGFSLWECDSDGGHVQGGHIVSGHMDEIAANLARRFVGAGKEFPGAVPEDKPAVPKLHGQPVAERKGRFILAKPDGDDYPGSPVCYSNVTQARKRCEGLRAKGVPCQVLDEISGRPWVEILKSEPAEGLPALPVAREVVEEQARELGRAAYAAGLSRSQPGADPSFSDWILPGAGRYMDEAYSAWAQGWAEGHGEDPANPRCVDCGKADPGGVTSDGRCWRCHIKAEAARLRAKRPPVSAACPTPLGYRTHLDQPEPAAAQASELANSEDLPEVYGRGALETTTARLLEARAEMKRRNAATRGDFFERVTKGEAVCIVDNRCGTCGNCRNNATASAGGFFPDLDCETNPLQIKDREPAEPLPAPSISTPELSTSEPEEAATEGAFVSQRVRDLWPSDDGKMTHAKAEAQARSEWRAGKVSAEGAASASCPAASPAAHPLRGDHDHVADFRDLDTYSGTVKGEAAGEDADTASCSAEVPCKVAPMAHLCPVCEVERVETLGEACASCDDGPAVGDEVDCESCGGPGGPKCSRCAAEGRAGEAPTSPEPVLEQDAFLAWLE